MEQKLVLFLKGIDYTQLNLDYKTGTARHIGLPKSKLKLKSNKTISGTLPGISSNDNTFVAEINCQEKRVYVTSNCEDVNNHREGEIKYGGICHWCREPFEGPRLGIPLEKLNEGEANKIYTEFCNCSLNCALAELYMRNPEDWRKTDYKYDKSESLLRLLHDKLYPGKILYPSPDYKLLTTFGGCLSPADFHASTCVYSPIPGVILHPVKSVYVKLAKPQ